MIEPRENTYNNFNEIVSFPGCFVLPTHFELSTDFGTKFKNCKWTINKGIYQLNCTQWKFFSNENRVSKHIFTQMPCAAQATHYCTSNLKSNSIELWLGPFHHSMKIFLNLQKFHKINGKFNSIGFLWLKSIKMCPFRKWMIKIKSNSFWGFLSFSIARTHQKQ